MFSYAGINLSDPLDPDAEAPGGLTVSQWIADNIKPEEIFPLASTNWPGTITGGPILERTVPPWKPVRLHTLFWPWGAARFAQAHFVVDDTMLAAIRQQIVYNGVPRSRQLVMSHGDQQIAPLMWMLPARPLGQPVLPPGTQGSMWFLTLVDERYWWWDVPIQSIVHDPHTEGVQTTWSMLYSRIATALGLTISVDTIPSAYRTPAVDYSSYYRPLPLYLDTVAWSVGQRIVRKLDGTVVAQNWSSARANTEAQANQYTRYVGGRFALKATD